MYQFLIPSQYSETGYHRHIAIVVGWYPLSVFCKKIDKSLYAVAGNLFSKKIGSNFLIRNLLYNPSIKYVLILKSTKEDEITNSCTYLYDLLTGEIPLSEINDIEATINRYSYQELISDLTVEIHHSIETLEKSAKAKAHISLKEERPKYVFKLEQTKQSSIMPAYIHSQVIQADTIDEAHIECLRRIRSHGRHTGKLQELLGFNITINKEISNFDRFINSCNLEDQQYISAFLNGTNSLDNYGYGDRLREFFGFNQINNVILKLTSKPESLAANMVIWNAEDLVKGNSPCLTQIWVRLHLGSLDLFAIFRSNDMFRAWRSNVSALRALQIKISDALVVKSGKLSTISLSAHIYSECQKDIDKLIKSMSRNEIYYSAVGNFIITVDSLIRVTQLGHAGEWIAEYYGKHTTKLLDNIISKNPTIEPNHSAYLAIEIQIAEMCLIRNIPYVQDIIKLHKLVV